MSWEAPESVGDGKKYRTIVVGAAGQRGRKYTQAMHDESELVELCALVDRGTTDLTPLAARYDVPFYTRVDDALRAVDFDLCLLTVPHHLHYELTAKMLRLGKHVIKEKPFAVRFEEAQGLTGLAQDNSAKVLTITQRSSKRFFKWIQDNIDLIKEPNHFKYEYYKNLPERTVGWRGDRLSSCGGVVLDMGFHMVDVLVRLFGKPTCVAARMSYCYPETLRQGVEDSAAVILSYAPRNLHGSMLISRHHFTDLETLEIIGSTGTLSVTITDGYCSMVIYSRSGEIVKQLRYEEGVTDYRSLLRNYILGLEDEEYFARESEIHLNNVNVIHRIYQSGMGSNDGPSQLTADPCNASRSEKLVDYSLVANLEKEVFHHV